jgi:ubiquinone/menaquinone biosynthesis C-methylase UbiE
MPYGEMLKNLFPGVILSVEDLLFLESFQILYLPDRVPGHDFAVLIGAHPIIHRYLTAKCPSIAPFIDSLLQETSGVEGEETIEECCNNLLWEIADLIVYAKYPDLYDKNVDFPWTIDEIIPMNQLEGKVAVDAGAGPGKLAFLLAQHVGTVFAVEPVQAFREYMKDKAESERVENLFVVDGFVNSLPFPSHSIDLLVTSNAIGWDLEDELREIERVLGPKGVAVHLFRVPEGEEVNQLHDILTASAWNYSCATFPYSHGSRIKYSKTMDR